MKSGRTATNILVLSQGDLTVTMMLSSNIVRNTVSVTDINTSQSFTPVMYSYPGVGGPGSVVGEGSSCFSGSAPTSTSLCGQICSSFVVFAMDHELCADVS